MNRFLKQIVIILISSSLLACSNTGQAPDRADSGQQSRNSDCISEGTVRDYTVLDDATLIVTASGRRNYLLELSRRAFGLRSSWQIGFTSPSGQICGGFSSVVFDDAMGLEKIRIRSIRRLSDEEVEALLIRYGRKKPEIEHTPTHEPVDSAEVEELDEVAGGD